MSEDARERPAAPGSADDIDALCRLAEQALGHPGALIAWSWARYRRRHPTHLAVKNAGLLLAATGDELWWGDLDVTLHAERLREAARLVGHPLALVYESGRSGDASRGPFEAFLVLRASPDGRLDVAPRVGYVRRGRVYRQTRAGYARWERTHRRADPAQLRPRERWRILQRLSEVTPPELPRSTAEERLALTLAVDDDLWLVAIPALGLAGRDERIEEALRALATEVARARSAGPPIGRRTLA